MFLSLIRYIPSAVVDFLADVLAFLLAPLAAIPTFIYVGKDGREYIHPYWSWITTHDAPIDAGRVDGYFTVPDTAWGRYVARVKWIWRNPAYRVSHWLGFNQKGIDTTRGLYRDPDWDTGKPNRAFWKVKNGWGQTGFLYQKQAYWGYDFTKLWNKLPSWLNLRFIIELQFGWKLYRNDPDEKCMLAFRISPFKRY